MMDFIRIKHSFNAGDLIAAMPGLRQLYTQTGKKVKIYQRLDLPAHYYDGQINSTVDAQGNSVCMNLRLFNMMKPLVEVQNYIESFEVWEGQEVDLDYDLTRDRRSIPMPNGTLHTWPEAVFPETSTDLSEMWITGLPYYLPNASHYYQKVIISRTQRYNNPFITYYFLKDYQDKIVFSGTEQEHEFFCKQNNLQVELIKCDDFLELAEIITYCIFGIYNQSVAWHIADSMKRKRVLEVCQQFPNTFATGANGYHAFGQQGMEYYFKKLIG